MYLPLKHPSSAPSIGPSFAPEDPHGLLAFAMRAVSTTFATSTRASAISILIIANTSILIDLLTRKRHSVAHLWARLTIGGPLDNDARPFPFVTPSLTLSDY